MTNSDEFEHITKRDRCFRIKIMETLGWRSGGMGWHLHQLTDRCLIEAAKTTRSELDEMKRSVKSLFTQAGITHDDL